MADDVLEAVKRALPDPISRTGKGRVQKVPCGDLIIISENDDDGQPPNEPV